MRKDRFFPILLLLLLIPFSSVRAEKYHSPKQEFSIEPSEEWMQLPMDFQSVVVSYGKKGTLATFHISERELEVAKTIQELKWEDLFSPEFESIAIHKEGETSVGGEKAKYCLYTFKPGPFKTKMEGKLPGKYMNYVLIYGNKLFSITFKDTEESFGLNYPSFLAAIRTLQFSPSNSKKAA